MTPIDPSQPLWTDLQVAEFLQLSSGTLRKARMTGGGPPFLKIGNLVRYLPSAVQEWCAERVRRSTAEQQNHPPLVPQYPRYPHRDAGRPRKVTVDGDV
jgi:predicted DNA-binding transcriptional regulator AlpA